MTFTVVEWFALVIAVVIAIKLLVILIKPSSWFNLVDVVWKSPLLLGFVSFILSAVVLYYLIGAGITIVQIFAVMLFFALLAAIGVAAYSKEVLGLAKKLTKDKKILARTWYYIVIWIALVIWVLYTLFA